MTDLHFNTLDLNFLGIPGAIASYLIPTRNGAILIESGPGSTVSRLQAALREHGYTEKDLQAVFLTHIHLDHAGAAGWLARQGAQVYVHPLGAPHLLNPEKLLASARRIYGDQMETLWGEFLSVPEEKLTLIEDDQVIELDHLRLRTLETPGHANHHHAYMVGDVCFTGDIGGVRMQNSAYLSVPMPPPEFILEKWRLSVARLQLELEKGNFRRLAPTHFGVFEDPAWHLARLSQALNEIEAWIEETLPGDPDDDQLYQQFMNWNRRRASSQGLDPAMTEAYEAANPAFISVAGIRRYWNKYRAAEG